MKRLMTQRDPNSLVIRAEKNETLTLYVATLTLYLAIVKSKKPWQCWL